MSYLKINKNNLSLIKDELNNCYTSIDDSIKSINNNIPAKKALNVDLNTYIQKGIDYTKIGTEYNNSIDTIKDNVSNSTVLRDLKSIIDDIDSIIKTVDEFNSTDYSKHEKKMATLYEKLLFLENIESNQETVEWETSDEEENTSEEPIIEKEDIVEEPIETSKEELDEEIEIEPEEESNDEEQEEKPTDNDLTINNEDLFAKIKLLSDSGTTNIDISSIKENKNIRVIDLSDDEEDIEEEQNNIDNNHNDIVKEEKKEEIKTTNIKLDNSDNNYLYTVVIIIVGLIIIMGLGLVQILNTLWVIILSVALIIITILINALYKPEDIEDKKE